MPIEKVKYYKSGGRLLIFSTGKTKYVPSEGYLAAKSSLHIAKGKKKKFVRKPTIQESCDRFFDKIFEEARKKQCPKRALKM